MRATSGRRIGARQCSEPTDELVERRNDSRVQPRDQGGVGRDRVGVAGKALSEARGEGGPVHVDEPPD